MSPVRPLWNTALNWHNNLTSTGASSERLHSIILITLLYLGRWYSAPPKKKERKKEKKRKQSWNQKLSTCKLLDIFLSQGPLWGRRSKKAGCYEEGTFHYNFELCITLIKVKLYHSGQIRTIFAYLVGIPEVGEKVGVDCWLNKKNLKKRSLKQTKCLEICKSYMNFTM